jgi:hypothetical protein
MNRIHQVPGLHRVEAQVVAGPKGTSRPSSFLGSGTKSKYYGDLRSSIGSVGGKIEKDLPELRSDTASEYSKETTSERTATMDSNIEIHQPNYDDDEEDEEDDNDDIMESSNRYSQLHIVNGNGNSGERTPPLLLRR